MAQTALKTLSRAVLKEAALILTIALISLGGATLFYAIEGGVEANTKNEVRNFKGDLVTKLVQKSGLGKARAIEFKKEANKVFQEFEEELLEAYTSGSLSTDTSDTVWSFTGSLFYVGTVFTTVGYGNIYPTTTLGKLLTIVYASVTIPLVLIFLDALGKIFTRCLKAFPECASVLYYSDVGVILRTAPGVKSLEERFQWPKERPDCAGKPLLELIDGALAKADESFDLPLLPALGVLTAYTGLGAVMYSLWEDLNFIDAFYFVFITISTIGFGDVLPAYPALMILTSLYVFVGLGVCSMVINVIVEVLQQQMQTTVNSLSSFTEKIYHSEKTVATKIEEDLAKTVIVTEDLPEVAPDLAKSVTVTEDKPEVAPDLAKSVTVTEDQPEVAPDLAKSVPVTEDKPEVAPIEVPTSLGLAADAQETSAVAASSPIIKDAGVQMIVDQNGTVISDSIAEAVADDALQAASVDAVEVAAPSATGESASPVNLQTDAVISTNSKPVNASPPILISEGSLIEEQIVLAMSKDSNELNNSVDGGVAEGGVVEGGVADSGVVSVGVEEGGVVETAIIQDLPSMPSMTIESPEVSQVETVEEAAVEAPGPAAASASVERKIVSAVVVNGVIDVVVVESVEAVSPNTGESLLSNEENQAVVCESLDKEAFASTVSDCIGLEPQTIVTDSPLVTGTPVDFAGVIAAEASPVSLTPINTAEVFAVSSGPAEDAPFETVEAVVDFSVSESEEAFPPHPEAAEPTSAAQGELTPTESKTPTMDEAIDSATSDAIQEWVDGSTTKKNDDFADSSASEGIEASVESTHEAATEYSTPTMSTSSVESIERISAVTTSSSDSETSLIDPEASKALVGNLVGESDSIMLRDIDEYSISSEIEKECSSIGADLDFGGLCLERESTLVFDERGNEKVEEELELEEAIMESDDLPGVAESALKTSKSFDDTEVYESMVNNFGMGMEYETVYGREWSSPHARPDGTRIRQFSDSYDIDTEPESRESRQEVDEGALEDADKSIADETLSEAASILSDINSILADLDAGPPGGSAVDPKIMEDAMLEDKEGEEDFCGRSLFKGSKKFQ